MTLLDAVSTLPPFALNVTLYVFAVAVAYMSLVVTFPVTVMDVKPFLVMVYPVFSVYVTLSISP